MNDRTVLKYVKETWDAIPDIDDDIPGGLSLDRSASPDTPYAVMDLIVSETIYTTDTTDNVPQAVIYQLTVEIRKDNPSNAELDTIEAVLNALAAAMQPGDAIGTGTLCMAWRAEPAATMDVDDDRDAGLDKIMRALTMNLHVQWRAA